MGLTLGPGMHHRAGESHRGFVRPERKVSPQFLLLLSPSHTSDLCLRLLLHFPFPLTSLHVPQGTFLFIPSVIWLPTQTSLVLEYSWLGLSQFFCLEGLIWYLELPWDRYLVSAAQMSSRLYSSSQPVGRDFGEVQMTISWGLQSGISFPCIYICEYPITNFVSFNLQCV